jgi:hypothetical protein
VPSNWSLFSHARIVCRVFWRCVPTDVQASRDQGRILDVFHDLLHPLR